jgi:PTH1 family peptidyl-tRNA hydrolase
MNLSGESVREILDFYKEDESSIIVVYDDTSLDIGSLRIREKGSAGGHNGIKNIISHLGTDKFIRIKVGVGSKPPGWDLADYVLSRFSKSEMESIVESVGQASDAVELILKDGVSTAMNKYNVKKQK